jgi:hypothetical protein
MSIIVGEISRGREVDNQIAADDCNSDLSPIVMLSDDPFRARRSDARYS